LVKISRTIYINVFRTLQNNPTGIFIFPEICQFIPPPILPDPILNQSLKKAIKKRLVLDPLRTSQGDKEVKESL
jgi:hypothetical protein